MLTVSSTKTRFIIKILSTVQISNSFFKTFIYDYLYPIFIFCIFLYAIMYIKYIQFL